MAAELMTLETGEKERFEGVSSVEFTKGSAILVISLNKPEGAKGNGKPMVIRDLRTSLVTRYDNVSGSAVNKPGSMLAFTVEAPDTVGNGLFLIETSANRLKALDTDKTIYSQVSWNKEGTALACLKGTAPKGKSHRQNSLEKGKLRELVYTDNHYGRVSKAKYSDSYLLTRESPREYSDYYVTDARFKKFERISDANPIVDNYNWYSNILIEYTNNDGERLQGVLMVPDTYKAGDKLPMLVDFYEKNSRNLNRWSRIIYRDTPMFPKYASNGYLVLLPDIHFRIGSTHSDHLECVTAAVNKVLEMGYANPERIGLHGHSFSGQGGNYIVTHTDMFACAVIGAGVSNLVSDFNQFWKSSGTNQHAYNHTEQGKFNTNPFDDLQLYIDQSAVYHARNMNTPLLLLQGVEDGSVEWLQAVEFYNALRFNGKNVILASYPGEDHHLAKHENKVDFQTRMEQFYDHYLKGTQAPDWMIRGVPFLEKKTGK